MDFLDSRLPDRFWNKCVPVPMTGCWIWIGSDNGVGYGEYQHDGRKQYSHRVTYQIWFGPILAGLELDHAVCGVPSCCNPLHLEAVSHQENVARGKAGLARRIAAQHQTHCKHGHEFTPANTYFTPSRPRARRCRECGHVAAKRNLDKRNAWQREYRRRKHAA